jgi:hypothetical protein
VEQTNYQEQKKIFSGHVADPSAITADHSKALESLLEKYPYSQLLRSFHLRSLITGDPSIFDKELSKAAIYSPDRTLLRTLIENADSLKGNPVTAQPQETAVPAPSEQIEDADESDEEEIDAAESDADEPEEAIIDEASLIPPAPEQTGSIEEEPEDVPANEQEVPEEIGISAEDQPETDTVLSENAAPTDYLKDDLAENTEALAETSESTFQPEIETVEKETIIAHEEEQVVSKYNDDKLPYSFLWWLTKTRKEHSDTYQPYVSFQLDTSQSIRRNTVDQLSSQIIENIFHLQSPVDQLENAPRTVPFQVKRKEDHIVEKFIREEPQIRAPNSEKLDTENKARKSAEDPNDLVSETLAHIYTDQMLFHKAVDTYKKLSLKFPEKSAYFADQIRELEKKVN